MFDPSEMLINSRFGYLTVHTRTDYIHGAPLRERLNPLRWEIGIGRRRPCGIRLNKGGRAHRRLSDFIYFLRTGKR